MKSTVAATSLFTDFDISLFKAGTHYRLYKKMGAHCIQHEGKNGVYFAVWAPNAKNVSVIGDFNGWTHKVHNLYARWDSSGIWEGFIQGLTPDTVYKYGIETAWGEFIEKGDPYAFAWELPPRTASKVWQLNYQWNDGQWMQNRPKTQKLDQPHSVYEVHIGSWRKKWSDDNRDLTYKELADELVAYVKQLNFTHVEFMPVMEHPFYGSWGYQLHGYFAPTSRYGTPEEFMYLVDAFHQNNIGVYLDWVPSHFPGDAHGLYRFDGTALYEHEDPRLGFHPDWNSYIFNYGRNEVRSFLISNAAFWMDYYHADGLRVDAVASMLYLDYSRKQDEWIPNHMGGRENLEAIHFMQELNKELYQSFPGAHTIAEESTSWPMVSKPTFMGGLGFGMKWMMGWMNDTLEYFKKDPIYRQYHQNELTFSLNYAFSENFMLPLSHDEVVHGKGALIERMPGDEWQRFANLRLLYCFQYMHPGTKLNFMGNEIGQTSEWKHDQQLPWHLTEHAPHKGIQQLFADLNLLYKTNPALYELQFSHDGFEWIELNDAQNSVLTFIRKGNNPNEQLIVAMNFTPNVYKNYQFGVPFQGTYTELFNSDKTEYWGSNQVNSKPIKATKKEAHGRAYSIKATIPPLGMSVFRVDPKPAL